MARILGLEEVNVALKQSLGSCLRVCDEAIVLPSASRSSESGAFKNIVFRLCGSEAELSSELFSENWFAGVSAVVVPSETAEELLRDRAKRNRALAKLAEAIPSEMADSDLQVGPNLEADSSDRDKTAWVAGFDSSPCCVGLFSAQERKPPDTGDCGMDRYFKTYYLVCKAGAGVSAQTFHTRLCAALRSGKSLDQALESGSEPGPQALRRVSTAARRNRQRILASAAEILGFHNLDTLSDSASTVSNRGIITQLDVAYNTLRRVENGTRSIWQYNSGCIDTSTTNGALCSSNVAEGFVAFTSATGDLKVKIRNQAHSSIPFCTPRLATTRDLATKAAQMHKTAKLQKKPAHPDYDFVRERFSWKAKQFGQTVDIEPPSLFGSHAAESFLSSWSRELGLAACKQIRMQPEICCISALEPGKLRAAVRHIERS
jgi:hypothetical protein